MSFTNAELVAIRRFCGYGYKTNISLTIVGDYGNLEFRLKNMDADEIADLRSNYLSNLQTYEDLILTASDNMDTQQAAVFYRNPKELMERTALFTQLRIRLCQAVGIHPGPGLSSGKIVRC